MRSIMRSHKIAVSFTSLRSGHHSLVIGNLAMFVWIDVSQINFLWRNIPRYQQPISWYRGCNLVNLHFCLFLFVEFPLNRHFIHWSGSFPFRVDYLKSLVFSAFLGRTLSALVIMYVPGWLALCCEIQLFHKKKSVSKGLLRRQPPLLAVCNKKEWWWSPHKSESGM